MRTKEQQSMACCHLQSNTDTRNEVIMNIDFREYKDYRRMISTLQVSCYSGREATNNEDEHMASSGTTTTRSHVL